MWKNFWVLQRKGTSMFAKTSLAAPASRSGRSEFCDVTPVLPTHLSRRGYDNKSRWQAHHFSNGQPALFARRTMNGASLVQKPPTSHQQQPAARPNGTASLFLRKPYESVKSTLQVSLSQLFSWVFGSGAVVST